MAKYLDEDGLKHLWSKIEDKFVDNSELSLSYDKENKQIKLSVGSDVKTISTEDFIKDGMLQSVTIVEASEDNKITINDVEHTSGKFIKFTWNDDDLVAPVYIALSDLNEPEKLEEAIIPLGVTVGNLNSENGLTAGMTLTEVLKKMLIKTIDVTATKPSVTLNITATPNENNLSYEVGSTVNINLSHTYTDGKFTGKTGYTYNKSAQCNETSTEYFCGSNKLEGNTHELIVPKNTTSYKCMTSYNASDFKPVKNDGTKSDVNIPAGSCESSLKYVYGYYKYFLGVANYATAAAFIADETSTGGKNVTGKIRDLSVKSGFVKNDSQKIDDKTGMRIIGDTAITVNSNDDTNKGSIILAIPDNYELHNIEYSLGASMVSNFSETVDTQLTLANGDLVNYTIYMYPMATPTEISFKNLNITNKA